MRKRNRNSLTIVTNIIAYSETIFCENAENVIICERTEGLRGIEG